MTSALKFWVYFQVPLKKDTDVTLPKEKGNFFIRKLAKGMEKVGRKLEKTPKAEPPNIETANDNETKVC